MMFLASVCSAGGSGGNSDVFCGGVYVEEDGSEQVHDDDVLVE